MMRMRNTKTSGMGLELPSTTKGTATAGGEGGFDNNWEMRPGGMLVQKRTDSETNRPPPPTIGVRVKYNGIYHEVRISSQATFGDLKKMLSGPTGLHHQDQKLMFRDKERDSNSFLDTSGVKDKSKMVLIEDPMSQERRFIEMKKNAKSEKAAKHVSEISLEVDSLAGQVSALETVVSRGGKVVEKDLVNLMESLMNQLLRLDGINADGDLKLQRNMQVRRVQKFVEKLDTMKIKNSTPNSISNLSGTQKSSPAQQQTSLRFSSEETSTPTGEQNLARRPIEQPAVVITTQWETFDSVPAILPAQSPASIRAAGVGTSSARPHDFTWNLL